MIRFIQFICYAIVVSLAFLIQNTYAETNSKFVYSKPDTLNLRVGPGKKYPIKWVIKNRGEPLKVLTKFEQWLKVNDVDGDEGWVMEYLTTTKIQDAIVMSSDKFIFLYKRPIISSEKLVKISPRVRVKVKKCKEGWCNIYIQDFKGWIQKSHLWGV